MIVFRRVSSALGRTMDPDPMIVKQRRATEPISSTMSLLLVKRLSFRVCRSRCPGVHAREFPLREPPLWMWSPLSYTQSDGACLWQTSEHRPQSMQVTLSMVAFQPGSILIDPVGHTALQAPHPTQSLVSMKNDMLLKDRGAWPLCFQSSFLFSLPGVVTMTLSGVMTRAPFAVTAPLNICSTTFLKVSTTMPSV